jgi:hypothetical protein
MSQSAEIAVVNTAMMLSAGFSQAFHRREPTVDIRIIERR